MERPEDWHQIETIFHRAAELSPDTRASFLDKACAQNTDLRREVELLLAQENQPGLLAQPAMQAAAQMVSRIQSPWRLASGTRLGSYEIIAAVGVGGMAEVYRARDSKLNRDVAIKVLPESFAQDRERVARFHREAQLLASLNHPRIGAIYGLEESDGLCGLALEFVDGETLAERIARGRLSVKEALELACQIAEALEAAHSKGVVHRDLKPANIKVTREGAVKVLDFGLAKIFESDISPSDRETKAVASTEDNIILGTVGYMSPEQARGKDVDKRTDIWAWGCVLYEMLTGRRTLDGDSTTDVIAKIVSEEPDWTRLPPDTPASVRTLLRRALQKDRSRRLHDIADARIEIEEAWAVPDRKPPTTSALDHAANRLTRRFVVITAFLIALAAVAASVWSLRQRADPSADTRVRRVTITASVTPGGSRSIAVSRDGTHVAYVNSGSGVSRLYLRRLDQTEASILDGTDGASAPFWSPDGQWIGFFAAGKLKKVPVVVGPVTTICDAMEDTGGSSATWGRDGTIVFALPATARAGLMRVPSAGGTPQVLTKPDPQDGGGHGDPALIDNDRAVLFTTRRTVAPIAPSIMVRSLVTGEQRKLVDGTDRPMLTASGHLVFGRGSTLFAMPFEANHIAVNGSPSPVQEGLLSGLFDVSNDGLLVFLAEARHDSRSLVWVDRSGTVEPLLPEKRGYVRPRLSPDKTRLVVDVTRGTGFVSDIYVHHFDNGAFTRLTTTGGDSPIWTPGGHRIVFRTANSLYWQGDGTGTVETLIEPTDPMLKSGSQLAPGAWTPDGTTFAFVVHTSTANGADIWTLNLAGERKMKPVVQRPGDQWGVRVSPNGRWISYASNESGQFEVYVEPLDGGEKYPVSTDGGREAVWSPAGDELFYRASDRMMAVTIKSGPRFTASSPHMLFRGRYGSTPIPAYDVTRDGKRFVMVKLGDEELTPPAISVIENWFEELRRRVPVKQ